MGAFCALFLWMGACCAHFLFLEDNMNKKTRFLAQAGMIAALYVVLTHLQNFVWPESTSFAIQFRLSEALCVLAVMTPAAIPGLTIGCLVYNLTYIGALPLDWLIGSAATLLAALSMWGLRKVTIKGYPLPPSCARPVERSAGRLGTDRVHRGYLCAERRVCGHRRGHGAADSGQRAVFRPA